MMSSIIVNINGEKKIINNINSDKLTVGMNIIIQSKIGLENVKIEKILNSRKKEKSLY